MGAIRDAVVAAMNDGSLTIDEKRRLVRRIRGEALRDNLPALPFTYTPGPLTITVESARWDATDDYLEVVLTASITATGRVLNLDNPFRFVNPPTVIADPAGDVVREVRDRSGAVVETQLFREAPLLMLRHIITDAVVSQVNR